MNPENGIMKKAKSLKSFAMLLGIGLALVSTVFTVKLMITFGTSGSDKLLYATFGFLIQSAQTALYVYAAYALWVLKDTGKAIPGFALFALLFVLSLAGSIGSFVVSNRAQNVALEKNQKIKDTYDTEIASINKDSDSVNKQLEALKSKGVVTKAKGTEEKASEIVGKRSSLFEGKRKVISAESEDDPDALYKILGEFFGIAPNSAKMLLFTLYAVALELASVILLSYSMIMFGSEAAADGGGNYKPDYGIRSADGNFYINPRGAVAPAFNPAPAYANHVEKPERLDTQENPKRKAGFVPTGYDTGNADLDEVGERIKADLKKNRATGTGYSNKAATPDAIKFSPVPVPDPVTSTGPVTGMKLKSKPPVSVPDEDDDDDGEDMDMDKITRDYIAALFPVKADGSLTGRAQVARKLGVSEDLVRPIHCKLKQVGLIRVEGSKTFPECDKDEMLAAVS